MKLKKNNWIEPTRHETDEEIKNMIADCESTPLLSVAEAKDNTYCKLAKF